ncbi:hypothetical protein O3P69_020124 [Scylla paramamosain]|uniref:Uncharacterized protein n=1 Tax=Scylla paramamosain TaxID=85552 RepID=A0AAW0TMZ7_SCYPA
MGITRKVADILTFTLEPPRRSHEPEKEIRVRPQPGLALPSPHSLAFLSVMKSVPASQQPLLIPLPWPPLRLACPKTRHINFTIELQIPITDLYTAVSRCSWRGVGQWSRVKDPGDDSAHPRSPQWSAWCHRPGPYLCIVLGRSEGRVLEEGMRVERGKAAAGNAVAGLCGAMKVEGIDSILIEGQWDAGTCGSYWVLSGNSERVNLTGKGVTAMINVSLAIHCSRHCLVGVSNEAACESGERGGISSGRADPGDFNTPAVVTLWRGCAEVSWGQKKVKDVRASVAVRWLLGKADMVL